MAPRAHPHQPGRPGADLPPILTQAGPVSARLLSEDERITIGDGLIARHSIRAIAAQLGRSPSTISREIQNNGDPQTGDYQPFRGPATLDRAPSAAQGRQAGRARRVA